MCFRVIRDVFAKPPSEREVARRSRDGRSLRDFGVLISFIVTHSPSVAFGASSLPEGALFSGQSRCLHKIRRDRRPRRSAKKQLPFPSFWDIRDVFAVPKASPFGRGGGVADGEGFIVRLAF